MKPMLSLVALVWFAIGGSLSAQSKNQWELFQTFDWSSRLAYLEDSKTNLGDPAFLLQVLDLVDGAQIEVGSDNEVALKKAIALKAIRSLAENPAPGAVALIGRIPRQYKDPILRGEAWLASARLGDQASVPSMVRSLASINDSGARSRGEEIQAAYLVQALGILKAEEAFRTIAAASLAWYSPASGVRAQAKKVLELLVPDGEPILLKILAEDEDLALKEGLFQVVVDQGDTERMGRAAASVLGSLVRYQARDKADQDRTERLTLQALIAAQRATKPPASLVPSLKLLLLRKMSQETMVLSIRLLGHIDDPSAVDLLTATLAGYNAQQKAGINSSFELTLVKELFQALGGTGKATAKTALNEARFSDYTPALIREAQEALDKLPRD